MTRHRRQRLGRAVSVVLLTGAALVAAAAALVLAAPAASAHSVLVGSSPTSGSTVDRPPADVTLTFNENVRAPAYVVVTGPGGTRVDHGSPQILDATVTQPLTTSSAAGTYTIAYRVVSADGHPVEAQLTYTVATAAAAVPSAAAPSGSGDGGHLAHVIAGVAVVVVGAGALVYERLQRGRSHATPADAPPPR